MRRRQTNILRSPKQVSADLKAIGRRIREIRGFDLTQGEFGHILGMTQAQLSKYELGLSAPTPDILLKLKAHSGKTIDWILTGEEARAKT
jgi:transcriptional regulator with XRE-family HTH domain